jgi:DNA-binding HxlR family transcriptional regulator
VLAQRLAEMSEAGILSGSDSGYALTAEGRSLIDALSPLDSWAGRWAKRVSAGERSR